MNHKPDTIAYDPMPRNRVQFWAYLGQKTRIEILRAGGALNVVHVN